MHIGVTFYQEMGLAIVYTVVAHSSSAAKTHSTDDWSFGDSPDDLVLDLRETISNAAKDGASFANFEHSVVPIVTMSSAGSVRVVGRADSLGAMSPQCIGEIVGG